MMLLAAVALRLVSVPVTAEYAYRMTLEMGFEAFVMWTFIIIGMANYNRSL